MKKMIGTALIAFAFTLLPISMNATMADASVAHSQPQMRKAVQMASAKKSHKHKNRHHKRAGRKVANTAA